MPDDKSTLIGAAIIAVHQAAHEAEAEEKFLLRQQLANVTAAWRALWEKAGCPAGVPE